MDFANDIIAEWGVFIPDWLFWVILVVVSVLVAAFYLFPKHLRKVADQYEIPFDRVDGLVKMLAMLAVRLYVIKKGVEETDKIARMKNVASMVDLLYPTTSTIRLSQLVSELERAADRKFAGTELIKHKEIVVDIQTNILNEVIKVGNKVDDNEHDPFINPSEIARWMKKGINAINVAQK